MGKVSRRILVTDSGLSEFYFSKKGMKQNKAKYNTQTPSTVTALSIPEERINTQKSVWSAHHTQVSDWLMVSLQDEFTHMVSEFKN